MKTTFAPWRMKFIKSISGTKNKGCLFCNILKSKEDRKNLVLYRGKTAFIILNLYPYNTGHLMVAPINHIKDFERLSDSEMLELMHLVSRSIKAIKKIYKPQGYNIGINLGGAAGAGVKGHMHIHVVPRWLGDNNFMPATCDTKVIPESLSSTYKKLKACI